MAVFYTNNLTGSDAAGDGSWANPFKSIYRGTQAIAANGDEVRVVGSDWSAALPGTLTFTYNSTTIATSQDLTSLFPELVGANDKVIITVDDDFGYERTVCTVVAVTSTTLTLHSAWMGRSAAFGVKRLDTQHYYISSTPTSPLGTSGKVEDVDVANVSLYTDIKVTGGWTADGVQSGITAFVSAYAGATSSIGDVFGQLLVQTGNDFLLSNFAATHFNSFTNSSAQRFALGKLWFVRIITPFSASSSGIFEPKDGSAIEWHVNDTRIDQLFSVGFGGEGTENKWKIWHTVGASYTNSKYGPTTNAKNILEYHLLVRSTDLTLGYPNKVFFDSAYTETIRIGDFYLYNNGPAGYLPIIGQGTGDFKSMYIARVFYGGDSVGILSAMNIIGQVTIGDGTQDLITYPWSSAGIPNTKTIGIEVTQNAWKIRSLNGKVSRLYGFNPTGQYAHSQIFVDIDNTDFVTGDSSLVLIPSNTFSGSRVLSHIAGVIPAFNDSRTVTMKMKTNDIDNNIWQKVQFINYKGGVVYQQNISLNATWTDYTFAFTPSTQSIDLNQYYNIVVTQSANSTLSTSKVYIDSISVA